ncbi:hypothetical protein AWZ03_004715 [Drosophila navojoa]|uniref:SCP domain-containing protein n=1 Tax=Drosophila navojoa TaxID=7232 RepID=A0A484BKS8_DRONA|nr:hypothetical protein AWZ03_004715 [Drosophila navojoa]
MAIPIALIVVFAHILGDFLVSDGAVWRIPLYKTKIPLYKREQPTVPKKPPDYCDKALCPRGVRHICCSAKFWGDNCPKPRKGINMKIHGAKIMAAHNVLRASLSSAAQRLPMAKPLPMLRWDVELAKVAMRVTNFCNDDTFAKCVNVPRFLNVGRTSYSFETSESAISSFIFSVDKFFKTSLEDFPIESVTKYADTANASHRAFAQLAYYKATKMGCGMLVRQENSQSIVYVTCLYNYQVRPSQKIYELANSRRG